MGFIPIVKQRYPDELLYSWLHRLATANGLLIKDFSNAYLGTKNAAIGKPPYDIRTEFLPLYEHMLIKPDLIDFFMSTNTFGFESMLMTEGQQTKVVDNVFAPKNDLNTLANGLIPTINVCPVCMEEDHEKYGEPYLHRHHQLSGVQTCHKHHCLLCTFDGKKGHACDYDLGDYKEIQTNISIDTHNAYTDYVSSLFEAELSTNIKVIKDILYSKLKEKYNPTSNGYHDFMKTAQNWKHKALIGFDVDHFLKVKMVSATNISATELIPLLMVLYPQADDLISAVKAKISEPLLREYDCPDCGRKYVSTPYAFRNRFGCTHCNAKLSEQEILKKIFAHSEYELKSDFESSDQPVLLYHTACEQNISIKPRSFLYDGVRCLCQSTITFKEAKERVEKAGEFDLLEYTSTETPCKIQAKSCGHIFETRYRKFIKSPMCRVCFPKNMTTEYLAERIKNTTNGEYELIGEFVNQSTKIKILHHRCGQITEYSPRYYHMGAVCPVCSNSYAARWEEMYRLLCEYKDEHGNVNIPKRDVYKGQNLGLWCQNQRTNSKLSSEKKQKLLDLDFSFDPLEDEWNRRFEQYQRYTAENGSPAISIHTDYENEHLGSWIRTQIKWFKTGRMSQTRIDKLLSVNKHIFD